MIRREIESELKRLAKQFKAVAVVGPRQSGKTTLTRYIFKKKPYANLENPDIRRFALDDPRGFLSQYGSGAVIDEAQRVPELFSYLQQELDENSRKGRFILTGSNNFLLQETISQSLAGRIAYLYLLPFTLTELSAGKDTDLAVRIIKGSYPPVYDQKIDPGKWYPNYIRTYVERDVRQIKNISDLNTFERFVRLCAGRSGQLLNLSSLALEVGIDSKTAGAWISVLESSFIVFRLYPWHRNFSKRIVKMPKLYFYDTGLVCSLLGISNSNQLNTHPLYGSIFENLIISELKKHCLNRSLNEDIFFWRDNVGHEVDVIIGSNAGFIPVEIKSGKTITDEFFKGLNYWEKISGIQSGAVVYGGEGDQNYSDGRKSISWRKLHMLFKYGSGSA
ncbi:MAG: ATP-binding protein [Spirochaetes bacterium]|nr:ATP-binding protein [Spirochaetota bacterium]